MIHFKSHNTVRKCKIIGVVFEVFSLQKLVESFCFFFLISYATLLPAYIFCFFFFCFYSAAHLASSAADFLRARSPASAAAASRPRPTSEGGGATAKEEMEQRKRDHDYVKISVFFFFFPIKENPPNNIKILSLVKMF